MRIRVLNISAQRLRQLWYAPVLALAMGLMMLRMLILARIFNLPEFGAFSAGLLISGTFCMVGCFGLQPMLQREWPMQIVRQTERNGLVRALQCNLVAIAICLVALIFVGSGFIPTDMSFAITASAILHGLAHQCLLVSTTESRSRGDVLRFAQQSLQRSSTALVLSVYVAYLTGSAVLSILVEAMVALALSIVFFRQAILNSHTHFRVRTLAIVAVRRIRMVSTSSAITLTILMIVNFMSVNADRWMAAALLDVGTFAQYGFAWIVLSLAQAAQLLISAALYPMVARRFAQFGQASAFRLCLISSISLLGAGSLLVLLLAQVLRYFIELWYPQYIPALVLIPWFLGIAVLRMSDFWSGFLLVGGHESHLLRINLAATILALVIWVVIVRPWEGGLITLADVGLAPVLLAVLSYGVVVIASWRALKLVQK